MQRTNATRQMWVVMAAMILAGILAVAVATRSGGTTYQSEVTQATVSAGGRWVLELRITNTGERDGTPACTVKAYDADGVAIATDQAQATTPIAAGKTSALRVLTGLMPGDHPVDHWGSSCS